MEFDEQQAIEFIRENSGITPFNYDDDEILNVIDIIFDYYEDNGFLDLSFEGDDPDADVIVNHVSKMLARDKGSSILPEHVRPIVLAELAYEESLNDF